MTQERTAENLAIEFIGRLVKGTPFEGKTFLAGGACRDEIMGKPIKDIDIVVSMPDGGIKFAEWVTHKIGAYKPDANPVIYPRFGTAKFNLRGLKVGDIDLSDVDIECVMTRGEKYEKGSRKPEVVYADLKDDAFRRDLTVNSLFKDVTTGEIKDLTGMGLKDIKAGIVRTPVDPDQTFKDDPLRMMRAVRFAVKYNWKMPKDMITALKANSDMLKPISKERIQDELNKILMTDNPDKGLRILSQTGLNKHIIPELDLCIGVKQNEYHKHDVYDHTLEVIKNTPPVINARLASLFHDIGKPETKSEKDGKVHFYDHESVGAEMAGDIMSRLRYPNEQIQSVQRIVANHMRLKQAGAEGEKATDKQLRKFMMGLGHDLAAALLMMNADNISHKASASQPNQIKNLAKKMKDLQTAVPSEKAKLPINGHDVIQALGIKPGPEVKDMLAAVQDAWYEDPNLSKEKALDIITQLHNKKSQDPKSSAKKGLEDLLKQKITNPQTGNKIFVRTALNYDKTHPVRKAAMDFLKRKR